jgi:Transposase DDE domain group 1
VALHGDQEGRYFHGYYDRDCYLPLYAFCGEHLLTVRLQTADGDGSRHTIEVMERIVRRLRAAWPDVGIVLRGDSGFSREAIYAWCEANKIDYVIGIARNNRLEAAVQAHLEEARQLSEKTGAPARVYTEFSYQTQDSWSRQRRVVAKAEYTGKANPRFVVTSFTSEQYDPQVLYERGYCPRAGRRTGSRSSSSTCSGTAPALRPCARTRSASTSLGLPTCSFKPSASCVSRGPSRRRRAQTRSASSSSRSEPSSE